MTEKSDATAVTAMIGLGANLGEPRRMLAWAVQALSQTPGVHVASVSSLFRSAPVDAGGPDFLNAVVAVRTTLDAATLLQRLQALEQRAGRERPYRHAPRVLDLDLLLHGDRVCDTPTLMLPHPRLHLRRFVLDPLHELAPDLAIPGLPPLVALRAAVQDQRVERIDDPGWASGDDTPAEHSPRTPPPDPR